MASGRTWTWWYEAVADQMLANPHLTKLEIATRLGKSPGTIIAITKSDSFKTYYAQRRADFTARHDAAIMNRLTKVAEASLDLISESLEKRRDQVPLDLLKDLATSSLEKLGYGTKPAPGVQVNLNQMNAAFVVPPAVDAAAIEEARDALRAVEQKRLIEARARDLSPFSLGPPAAMSDGPERVAGLEVAEPSVPPESDE